MADDRDQTSGPRKKASDDPGERLLDLSLQDRTLPVEKAQQELRSAPRKSWWRWMIRAAAVVALLVIIMLARGCYETQQSVEHSQQPKSSMDPVRSLAPALVSGKLVDLWV